MIITRKQYKRATWKNSLGFTDQIAIYPEGASLSRGDFLWRLSSARIEKDSPFSLFPAHDRVLVILKGSGIRMYHTFEPGLPDEIAEVPPLEPYEFPGDVPSRCEMVDGPVVDFSVFARTGEISATTSIQEIEPGESFVWLAEGKWNFAYVIENSLESSEGIVNAEDTLSVEAGEVELTAGDQRAKVLLVSLG